jgi:hypothetical protein
MADHVDSLSAQLIVTDNFAIGLIEVESVAAEGTSVLGRRANVSYLAPRLRRLNPATAAVASRRSMPVD